MRANRCGEGELSGGVDVPDPEGAALVAVRLAGAFDAGERGTPRYAAVRSVSRSGSCSMRSGRCTAAGGSSGSPRRKLR